jgi:hypothetical protein
MEVGCTGHQNSSSPFVDGKTYACMCFVCFNVPKTWEVTYGEAEDGSQDVWEGPFFDYKHLHTAKELVDDGTTDDMALARKSVAAVKKKITEAKKKGKL